MLHLTNSITITQKRNKKTFYELRRQNSMDTATLQETNFGADFGLDVFLGTVARTHNI
jgi:hypothetical protein